MKQIYVWYNHTHMVQKIIPYMTVLSGAVVVGVHPTQPIPLILESSLAG